jgi:Xaa-Pro aminopeptidase
MDHEGRFARLRAAIVRHDLDALLVTNLINVRYLTGFSGTNAQVLVTPKDAVFLSDPRYRARAAALVSGAEITIYPTKLLDALKPLVGDWSIGRLGVEGATMTLVEKAELEEALGAVDVVTTKGLVETLRRRKEEREVELIKEAIELGDRALAWLLQRLAPGATEAQIALELETTMRRWGADEVSFPPIVGSGPLSAHVHHTPTARELQKGDLVLLDLGCRVQGYCSDLTRTIVLGAATEQQLRQYDLVLRAQTAGIAAIRAGVAGPEVDAIARGIIDGEGLGDRFAHGLGHGVGLEVHEDPRLNRTSEDTLAAQDVVTVEPGVYMPDTGGVRIEDCVLVTGRGCEVLTSAPKDELIEL